MRVLPLLAALAASPAGALTCAPPDPLRSFREAQEAPERYVVLLGRLDFDAGLMPEGGTVAGQAGSGQDPAPVPARFGGESLTPEGFERSAVGAVALRPTCAGPWCGSIGPGEWLLFAEQGPGGWEVEVGPCGGRAFERPSPEVLDALAACMAGEACGS